MATPIVLVEDRRQQAYTELNAVLGALFDDASTMPQLPPLAPCSDDPVACERDAQTMQDTLAEIQRIVSVGPSSF